MNSKCNAASLNTAYTVDICSFSYNVASIGQAFSQKTMMKQYSYGLSLHKCSTYSKMFLKHLFSYPWQRFIFFYLNAHAQTLISRKFKFKYTVYFTDSTKKTENLWTVTKPSFLRLSYIHVDETALEFIFHMLLDLTAEKFENKQPSDILVFQAHKA